VATPILIVSNGWPAISICAPVLSARLFRLMSTACIPPATNQLLQIASRNDAPLIEQSKCAETFGESTRLTDERTHVVMWKYALKMAERGGAKMLTTREKILFDGEYDWVKLKQVHEYVAFEDLSASLAEVQRRTLELVRSMAEEGVIALGNLIERDARFKDWDIPLDEAIARISARVATMSSAKTALSTACRGLLRVRLALSCGDAGHQRSIHALSQFAHVAG
jgi:hypothetical protein